MLTLPPTIFLNDNSRGPAQHPTCDCGLPVEDCFDPGLGGAGGGDDGEDYAPGDMIFLDFDIETDPEALDAVDRVEAIASVGRILETQSASIAAYVDLVSETFGPKN